MLNKIDINTIYKAVDDVILIIDLSPTSTIQRLYYLIYGTQILYGKYITINKIVDKWIPKFNIDNMPESPTEESDENTDLTENIDINKLHEYLLSIGYLYFPVNYEYIYINIYKDKESILYLESQGVKIYSYYDNKDLYLNIQQHFIRKGKSDIQNEVGILVRNSLGYNISYMNFNKMNIDPELTYNDDIPLDSIENFILNENTGLCLFYGEPGTGKTTFIKYLIQKYNKQFIILNSDVLYDSTSHSLIGEFISNKNAIYIIEDCEKLLVSRNNEQNPIISAFLNMTDGILAEVISCKFICTFNTALTNIDDALLRKGRLKLKYEFKKLDKDKVNNIIHVNKDMTVAELFNYKQENDYSKKQVRKIGF